MKRSEVLVLSSLVVLLASRGAFADGMPEEEPPAVGGVADVAAATQPGRAVHVAETGAVAPPITQGEVGPLGSNQADVNAPAQPPLDVLLTQEPSRGSFKLAEQALESLRVATRQIRAARERYELAHVDYDRILADIEQLTRELERTFRPDRDPGQAETPFYPPAGPLVIDGRLWRVGQPTDP